MPPKGLKAPSSHLQDLDFLAKCYETFQYINKEKEYGSYILHVPENNLIFWTHLSIFRFQLNNTSRENKYMQINPLLYILWNIFTWQRPFLHCLSYFWNFRVNLNLLRPKQKIWKLQFISFFCSKYYHTYIEKFFCNLDWCHSELHSF